MGWLLLFGLGVERGVGYDFFVCFGYVVGVEWWLGVVFDHYLYGFVCYGVEQQFG